MNTIRRDVFLEEARQRLPGLYKLLWQAYSRESFLHFNESVIMSATGIQQGDPAGPALFAIGVDRVARASRCSDLSVWYLDDATLAGKPADILTDLETIIPRLQEIGLQVNDTKCQLYEPTGIVSEASTQQRLQELLPGIRQLVKEDVRLLGAPVLVEGITSTVEEKQKELVRLTERLVSLDPHTGFAILKNCVAVPKLIYTLRTTPFYRVNDVLKTLDAVISKSVCAVTNVSMSDFSLAQSQLPVRLGGIGVRRLSDLAGPAYLSSLHSTAQLSGSIIQNTTDLTESDELSRAVAEWELNLSVDGETDKMPTKPQHLKSQKEWDSIILQRQHATLLAATDQVSRSRLLAAACAESGQWLHAFPTPALGTHLDAESFRIAIAHRLGAEVCQPHRCRCGGQVDRLGLHPLSCQYSSGRAARHAAVNNIISRGLQTAGLPSILEPVGLSRSDGRRPDGMTTFPLKNGHCLVWDFTCVDTYARSHLMNSALTPGSAATAAEKAKRSKYVDIATRHIFEPIAVETTGIYGQTTRSFIRDLGQRIAAATGDKRETSFLQQRIGIAIARGNAMCVTLSGHRDHLAVPPAASTRNTHQDTRTPTEDRRRNHTSHRRTALLSEAAPTPSATDSFRPSRLDCFSEAGGGIGGDGGGGGGEQSPQQQSPPRQSLYINPLTAYRELYHEMKAELAESRDPMADPDLAHYLGRPSGLVGTIMWPWAASNLVLIDELSASDTYVVLQNTSYIDYYKFI